MPSKTVNTRTTDGGAVELEFGLSSYPFIQNLGDGKIYFGLSDAVTTDNGIQIPVDGAYEFPVAIERTGSVYLTSDTDGTDVRYTAL